MFINFISNDWDLVSLSNGKDILEMLNTKNTAAGVARGVDHDGRGVVVDEGLHLIKIGLPIIVGKKIVFSCLNFLPSGQCCVNWKS